MRHRFTTFSRCLSTLLGSLLLTGAPLAADYDIREAMPPEVFTQAGLEKLSPEELEVLNDWLGGDLPEKRDDPAAHEGPDLPEGDDAFGLESVKERVASLFESKSSEEIESRIDGTFTGWDGDTVFRLDNGQVWKQVQPDSFYINAENPKVTIKRALFGSYLLSVEGYGASVRVRRVE
ncbi:MAG: hypothetical protein R6V45_01750 [Oceanipulchritudo sp.]